MNLQGREIKNVELGMKIIITPTISCYDACYSWTLMRPANYQESENPIFFGKMCKIS